MTPTEPTRIRCVAQEKRDRALSLESRGMDRTAARLWAQADVIDAKTEKIESDQVSE